MVGWDGWGMRVFEWLVGGLGVSENCSMVILRKFKLEY